MDIDITIPKIIANNNCKNHIYWRLYRFKNREMN